MDQPKFFFLVFGDLLVYNAFVWFHMVAQLQKIIKLPHVIYIDTNQKRVVRKRVATD